MRSPSQVLALSLTVALIAAACGSSSPEASSPTTATSRTSTTSPGSASSATSSNPSSDTATSADSAASENLFPDIDVAVVGTGDTVNLKKELAGGDTPVLLWFWAPH